jgi:hypothetical protein
MTDFTATYSPEDNKLRIYASARLDDETYKRLNKAGFRWAPKQELFVAPAWSPDREDLCLELAGEIEPEQMTLAERAEMKADRLDALAVKRAQEASGYSAAAHRISQRFAAGQPILIGHHSERAARKDQERMDNHMRAAVAASKAADYWQYRATGVERHANMKNSARVRQGRIKRLLAELRDYQRSINHGHSLMENWQKAADLTGDEKTKMIELLIAGGDSIPWESYRKFRENEITESQLIEAGLAMARSLIGSKGRYRWIEHTLNRLAYEREELGGVSRYDGELTPVILKEFARTHGAHKPEAIKHGESWVLSSPVPLPLQIGDGCQLSLTGEQWRDLMVQLGYEVPDKKPAKPSILNFKAKVITGIGWGGEREFKQIEMTKAEYAAIYADWRGVKTSVCGQFRFKICQRPGTASYHSDWVAVFLTDSKVHPTPNSGAVQYE